MGEMARLIILIHDDEHNVLERANVSGRVLSKGRFGRIPYNKVLQRHVMDKLDPGQFEIRVKGSKGTFEENRTIKLRGGDNHVPIMLGRPGMLSFNAHGMKYYFIPRKGEMLLSVLRASSQKQVIETMERAQLKYNILPRAGGRFAHNDMLFVVSIGEGAEEKSNREKLERIVTDIFPKIGLFGRLAVPVYKRKKPAFGITNEIIVRFKSWVTVDQIKSLAKEFKLISERDIPYLGNAVLLKRRGTPDYSIIDIIGDMQKNADIVYAQSNFLQRLKTTQHTPNDYLYPESTHLPLINCDDAWNTLRSEIGGNAGGSSGITIAIMDLDGVDPQHPDLTGTLSDGSQKIVANFDFINMSIQTQGNLNGDHGTQCAGSAASRMDNTIGTCGVAPNCHLIGGQMSGSISTLDLADAWVWMAGFPTGSIRSDFPPQLTKGADIISNSWAPVGALPPQSLIRDVIDFLTTFGRGGRGCTLCFSAGNDGYTTFDTTNPFAADEKSFAIGSSINTNPRNPCYSVHPDHNGNTDNLQALVDRRSYYSQYGMDLDLVSPSHTCNGLYKDEFPFLDPMINPIIAPVRTGRGNWPSHADLQTTIAQETYPGNSRIYVQNSAGFQVNDFILFNGPGSARNEVREITQVLDGQIHIRHPLENGYSVGTTVIKGNNDYMKSSFGLNNMQTFGGTSHSCATVAGAAALLLSVKNDLTWLEVKSILRNTAVKIDPNQADTVGKWIDRGGARFSQWYGYGRLDIHAAVMETINRVNSAQRSDVVIRDNLDDTGVVPSVGWHANSPDIWVRQGQDSIPTLAQLPYDHAPNHQNPLYNQDNYVYLRVKNTGQARAPIVYLRALLTHFPGIEFQYPDDWQPTPRIGSVPTLPLETGTYLIGEEQVVDLDPNEVRIVGMKWDKDLVPPQEVTMNGIKVRWHPCLLAEVSPHDGPAPVANAYPVKGNNNLAHRNIAIDYPSSGSSYSSFLAAVVAGSRRAKGLYALLIDRTRVPPEYTVVVHTPDEGLMREWMKRIKSGKGLGLFRSLGELNLPGREREDKDLEHLLIKNKSVRDRLSPMCGGARIGEFEGRKVLIIDHMTSSISLPMKLAAGRFIPVLIGMERPGEQPFTRGTIRVSQIRADGKVSTGYEIEG
jgi:subtilisin family serine protease